MKREKQTLDMAISNIAHDIRTPLTIASGYTQQLIKSPEDKAETLQKIAQHLDLVSKRLEALLEYRRLMEGAVKPKLEEVDLSAFITKKTLAYYDVFLAASITLDFKVVSLVLKMMTDEDLLESNFTKSAWECPQTWQGRSASVFAKRKGTACLRDCKPC